MASTFNFERFTQVGKRYSVQISIRTSGVIGISQGAIHQAGMAGGDDWHVVLHYDRAQNALGLQPIKGGAEAGAIKVTTKRTTNKETGGTATSAFLTAKSFLDYYRIPYAEKRSFDATWDPQLKMIIAFLADKPTKNEPAAQG